MKNSNCFCIVYGFESGSNYILKILGKRIVRETNIRAYKLIAASGITPACSFMIGTPGETPETVRDTINAIQEAGMGFIGTVPGAVFYTTPYPGSRIYRWCIENGYIKDKNAFLDFISNRDAVKLSINFTSYPDVIIMMMNMLVENAMEDTRAATDPAYHIPVGRKISRHILVPLLYNSYFAVRRIVEEIIPAYRKERIEYKLNEKGTLEIAGDAE